MEIDFNIVVSVLIAKVIYDMALSSLVMAFFKAIIRTGDKSGEARKTFKEKLKEKLDN